MKKNTITKTQVIFGLYILFSGIFLLQKQEAYAATDVTIKMVDYENEEIVINDNDNTKIHFATETDAAKGIWDVIDVDNNSDKTTTIDFSWISPNAEGSIVIKGDLAEGKSTIVIQERTRKLQVSINYANLTELSKDGKETTIGTLLNIMSTAGNGDAPINFNDLEWKKGANGKWKAIGKLNVGELEKLQIKGADLYFRIAAVNDTTDGSKGRRASSEVKVKINRKSIPMVVDIDGSEFTTEIKYGNEYRVKIEDGSYGGWIKVTDRAIKDLPLSDIVSGADGLTPGTAFPKMNLEVRNYATSKTAPSKITEIKLKEQRKLEGKVLNEEVPTLLTDETKKNVYITYFGDKYLNITVPLASTIQQYEYCIVKKDEELNPQHAAWYSITKNVSYKVLATKAIDEGTLYIRQKEIINRGDAYPVILASTNLEYTIDYPSIPMIQPQTLNFTRGYTEDLTFDIKLNISGKKAFENNITSIKLGTKSIEFNDEDIKEINGESIMTVVLPKSSLESAPNCYNRALYIYFENGTINKTSVKLTVKDPSAAGKLVITPKPGTTGTTTIDVFGTLAQGNKYVYKLVKAENVNTEEVLTGYQDLAPNLTIPQNSWVTVYEINTASKVVKCQYVQILDVHIGK